MAVVTSRTNRSCNRSSAELLRQVFENQLGFERQLRLAILNVLAQGRKRLFHSCSRGCVQLRNALELLTKLLYQQFRGSGLILNVLPVVEILPLCVLNLFFLEGQLLHLLP